MNFLQNNISRAFGPTLVCTIVLMLAVCCWGLVPTAQTEAFPAAGDDNTSRASAALDITPKPSAPPARAQTVSFELNFIANAEADRGPAEPRDTTAGSTRAVYWPVVFSVDVGAEGLLQPANPVPNDVFSLGGAGGYGYATEGELFQSSGAVLGTPPDITNVDRLSAALGVGPAPGGPPPFMGSFPVPPVPAPPGGPLGTLGLVPTDNVNALSFGEDGGCVFLFSVDPNAVGSPATGVFQQSSTSLFVACQSAPPSWGGGDPGTGGNQAAGDIFISPNIGAFGNPLSIGPLTPAPPFSNLLWCDGWGLGLQAPANACTVLGPEEDDLNALEVDDADEVDADMDGVPDMDTPVFFSLDPLSPTITAPTPDPFPGACTAPDPDGVTPDDILVSGPLSASTPPLPPMAFAIYASGVQDIGLLPGDDIDALVLYDISPSGWTPDGILTPGLDTALFSLAAGSPSLIPLPPPAGGTYESDVFITTFNGTFSLGCSHLCLGLQDNDELDALDMGWWFPPSHGPVNREVFPNSLAEIFVDAGAALGSETIRLSGVVEIDIDLTTLADADTDGLEEVSTEMIALNLTGESELWGPVSVRLRPETEDPFLRSFGRIEENVNNTPGVLDLPPFTATGTATSDFDVYWEMDVGTNGLKSGRDPYYNRDPKQMKNPKQRRKDRPDGPGYRDPYLVPVYRGGVLTSVHVGDATHRPRPPWPDPHGTVFSFVDFGTGGTNVAIPADFFGPGSDPFEGQVALDGGFLNLFTLGDASNLFQRWGDPIWPEDPVGTNGTVDLEITELDLVSIMPITVTYNGGLDPEEWDVTVGLSEKHQFLELGTLTATKTHDNGGTFDTTLSVQPKLTFTRLSDGAVLVLDTGLEERPPLVFTSTNTPWVHELGPDLDILAPDDGFFVPMVEEDIATGEQWPAEMHAYSDAPAEHVMRPATTAGVCVTLQQFAEFVDCLEQGGPDMPVPEDCSAWDGNDSGHVDLGDFALIQQYICLPPPPPGACCAPATGICTDMTESECASAGGEFQGYGTSCPLPPLPADPNPCASPYCPASGGCGPYITSVDGAIPNASGACHGYADYTWLKAGMPIGSINPISVTNGAPDPGDECGIWVDWNQNSDFGDPGEEIPVMGTPGTGPYDATITPPVGAVLGETRMRIRIVRMDPLDPCGDTAFGEVEDYTITVMPEVP